MPNISQSDVIAAIEKALEKEQGAINENTQAEEIDTWDSLGQLSILVALDKLFGGKIANITEMADAHSVGKILAILRNHALI